MLDDLHSFGQVGFLYYLCGDPEGLLVYKSLKVAQVARRLLWVKLEEVTDVIRWFNAGEEQIVSC